jgi:signal transduction histidine kinase
MGARAHPRTAVTNRPSGVEGWISLIRVAALPFAVLEIVLTDHMPAHDRSIAWGLTGILAIGALVLIVLGRHGDRAWFRYSAMAFDFCILGGYVVLYAFELGTPTRQLLLIGVVAGAVRFGMWGGVLTALAYAPVSVAFEVRRADLFDSSFRADYVVFQVGSGLVIALLVGWLFNRIDAERRNVERRAQEAEALRDELGRRADLLDAASRCARALNSSLDLDEASSAFIRELRGVVPFDRMAIVLAEEGVGRVIAVAGERAEDVMPPGTVLTLEQNLLAEIVVRGQTVVRRDMAERAYAEEEWMVGLGLRSRVVAPLLAGARAIGLISLVRRDPDAFTEEEIELVGLLGRLTASAVVNIRAYESERRTVDELRRLSALRADFVSLVSHELRSPMAAVIGAARTLQQRGRELKPEQRESFLALIADETARLAELIGDVLDTSRIEAGTFTYRFGEVDLARLVEEIVATAAVGQDDVPLAADVVGPLPAIQGDGERLRQVLGNLIENAVKYSPAGAPVRVHATTASGEVIVSVEDRGPGIAVADQRLIFEKFGRAGGTGSKPGSGLGLFIARSIAEAHGGTLDVTSAPGRGATFLLKLPV